MVYAITALAGILKLITFTDEPQYLGHDTPKHRFWNPRQRRVLFMDLFYIYRPEDFAQTKNPYRKRLMRFSNACAYIFYTGALLSLFVFCASYHLFFG